MQKFLHDKTTEISTQFEQTELKHSSHARKLKKVM